MIYENKIVCALFQKKICKNLLKISNNPQQFFFILDRFL